MGVLGVDVGNVTAAYVLSTLRRPTLYFHRHVEEGELPLVTCIIGFRQCTLDFDSRSIEGEKETEW